MTHLLLRQVLSVRYISVAFLTISTSTYFSLAAHSCPLDKDPGTSISLKNCDSIDNIEFASNLLCVNGSQNIDIGSNVTYSNLRINTEDVKYSMSHLSELAFSSDIGNYKYTISSPISLLPEQYKY